MNVRPTLWIVLFALLAAPMAVAQTSTGFRGDGSGKFLDARPVTTWSEYTYEEVKQGKHRLMKPTGDNRSNIAWQTPLPSWGNGGVIAVGDRLYVVQEMDFADLEQFGPRLICLDAATGKILFQSEINYLNLLTPQDREAVKALWLKERAYIGKAFRLLEKISSLDDSQKDEIIACYKQLNDMGLKAKARAKKDGTDAFPTDGSKYDAGDEARALEFPKEIESIEKQTAPHGLWWPMWSEPHYKGHGKFMGDTMPTPVSDGTDIFVRTGHQVLACLSAADGKLKWMVQFSKQEGYTNFASSPILVGDRVIVHTLGARSSDGVGLRVFDKATGKQIYELPQADIANSYMIGTPVAMKLDGVDVVALADGRLVRVSDGKVLAEHLSYSNGATNSVAEGDTLYVVSSQEGGGYNGTKIDMPQGVQAIRFKLNGDKAEVKRLWHYPSGGSTNSLIVHDGKLYVPEGRKGLIVLDAETGKELTAIRLPNRPGWVSYMAGDFIFLPEKSGTCSVVSVSQQKAVASNRLGDSPYGPYWGAGYTSTPMTFIGDRTYIRHFSTLYCLKAQAN